MTRDALIKMLRHHATGGMLAGNRIPQDLLAEALIHLLEVPAPVYVIGGLPTVSWEDIKKDPGIVKVLDESFAERVRKEPGVFKHRVAGQDVDPV